MTEKIFSPSEEFVLSYKANLYEFIKNFKKTKESIRILDVGCGKGEDLAKISELLNVKIYGLDLSWIKLTATKERLKESLGVSLIQADATRIPFKEAIFDIILASEIIEHLEDTDVFIEEAKRILVPGGYFIITTPPPCSYTTIIGKLFPEFFKKRLRKFIYFRHNPLDGIKEILPNGKIIKEHVHEFTPYELKRKIFMHGLITEKIYPGNLRPFFFPLFDKIVFLMKAWECLDKITNFIPFFCYLKANFMLIAQKIDLKKSKKIIIINLGGVGDLLLASPALKAIRKEYLDARISILVAASSYDYVKTFDFIDEVFLWNSKISLVDFYKNIRTLIVFRKRHFDLLVNMRTLSSSYGAKKMQLLISFINPKIKAGRDTQGRGYFFNLKIPEIDEGEKYERDYDLQTATLLGAQIIDKSITFNFTGDDLKKVDFLLEKANLNQEKKIVAIHPGGEPSRRWPIDNFVELIKKMSSQGEYTFVITGSGEESRLAKIIIRKSQIPVMDLTGKLSITQLGALIKRSHLFISNDTGPMHIASVLGVPLVAIFGPGSLVRYDPRNVSSNAKVVYNKVPCAPCNKKSCFKLNCLKNVPVEEVYDAAIIQLAKKDWPT